MAQYISKAALVAEIERRNKEAYGNEWGWAVKCETYAEILSFLDTLEVKEIQEEPTSTAYVVTRCEEHSDYVEEVFFDKDKAQEYCDQFKGNENEYARHITKVKVTL